MAIDMKATDAALKSASKVEEGKAGSDVTAAATPINKWIIIGVTSVVLIGIIIGILFGTKVLGGGGDASSGAQELSESDMNSLLNEAAQFNGDREIAEVVPTIPTIPTTTTIAAPASTQAPKAPIVLNTSFRCEFQNFRLYQLEFELEL